MRVRAGVKKEQRCFTDEEVGKILAAAAAPEPFGTILALAAVLGLRIGEGPCAAAQAPTDSRWKNGTAIQDNPNLTSHLTSHII